MVVRFLAKEEVAGSNPVSRSIELSSMELSEDEPRSARPRNDKNGKRLCTLYICIYPI